MKTKLQRALAQIAPSISIQTIWEHDPDCEREFRELSKPGNCFAGEDREAWEPWQSEVRSTAIQCGEEVTGSAYLGGTWEKAGDHPSESNPDISGYELQMTQEALEELRKEVSIVDRAICSQIDRAIAHIKSAAKAEHEAQTLALA